jgi:uncharacterized peroxidase-related enzyme
VSRATPPGTPPWIATVAWQESSGVLRDAYDWQAASLGEPTEFTMLGSLAPELVRLRLELYRTVENVESGLSRLERRVVAYVTSTRNGTPHCSSGLERQLDDLGLAAEVVQRAATTPEQLASGDDRLDAIAAHAAALAARPWEIDAGDLDALRSHGLDDVDLVDLNNIVAYYAYINRVANGLGLFSEIPEAHARGAVPR